VTGIAKEILERLLANMNEEKNSNFSRTVRTGRMRGPGSPR
jgi:hypothetical protein